ncbi:hypothetical protein [Rivibacter subsaxonicus]|uniref:hypothetical protein n=1 Tax=Rivibacter subsaxonicus TaxID=457575 RepID=UPI00102CCA4F|nr:hypothetical protein [Rivibacter subsaxonicus]
MEAEEVVPLVLKMPWWAAPTGICLGFLLPVLALVAYAGTISHRSITVRGLEFLTTPYLLLAAVLLVASALAGWIGQQIVPRRQEPERGSDLARAAKVVGFIALFAYCAWLRGYLFNPYTVFLVLTGQLRPERFEIGGAGGLESLLNFTPVFFSLVAYAALVCRTRLDTTLRALLVALTLLTLYRVYLWSERLALIEIALPVVLAWVLAPPPSRLQGIWRLFRRFGPYAALPLLIAYFGITEYTRSWQAEAYFGKTSFVKFAAGRFASYYYTALNNGAGILSTTDKPTLALDSVLLWLHRFPLGVGAAFQELTGFKSQVGPFLTKYGDIEFNNPSGLFLVVSDIGLAGALSYFAIVALVAAVLMRRYERGDVLGIVLYPAFYMSLVEIFRYPYLGQPRAFSQLLAGLIAVACVLVWRRTGERYRRRRVAVAANKSFNAGTAWPEPARLRR